MVVVQVKGGKDNLDNRDSSRGLKMALNMMELD
jgi:hypothetical protein